MGTIIYFTFSALYVMNYWAHHVTKSTKLLAESCWRCPWAEFAWIRPWIRVPYVDYQHIRIRTWTWTCVLHFGQGPPVSWHLEKEMANYEPLSQPLASPMNCPRGRRWLESSGPKRVTSIAANWSVQSWPRGANNSLIQRWQLGRHLGVFLIGESMLLNCLAIRNVVKCCLAPYSNSHVC